MRSREKNKSIQRKESGYKMGRDSGETWKTNTNQKDNGERKRNTNMKYIQRKILRERKSKKEVFFLGGGSNGVEREQKRQRENRKGDKGNQTGNGESW